MKTLLLLTVMAILFLTTSYSQSVAINNDGSPPDSSAMLDVNNPNKGMLIPRVSLTGRTDTNTIPLPTISLLVYNTNTMGSDSLAVSPGYYYWDGTIWLMLTTGSGGAAISLTTLGTSGAASLEGSVLNIPVYAGGAGGLGIDSIRQPLSTDSLNTWKEGIVSLAYRERRIFNVKRYGAKGDGIQNDQDSIQAAINACYNAGGGTVYFPNGFYLLSGALKTSIAGVNPNSQLYIPAPITSRDTNRSAIILMGESEPSFINNTYFVGQPYTPTRKGVVLYSTIAGSGIAPSVLGSIGPATSYANFNYENVSVRNITMMVRTNATLGGPTIGGMNFQHQANVVIENYMYTIDSAAANMGVPTNEIAGIIMPQIGGELNNIIRNVMIIGSRYGIVLSEHSNIDVAVSAYCYAAFVMTYCYHPILAGKLETTGCLYSVYVPTSKILGIPPGISYFNIKQLNTELWSGSGNWYDYRKVILDTSILGRGTVNYHIVQAGGTINYNLFNKHGGDSVYTKKMSEQSFGWNKNGNYTLSTDAIGTLGSTSFNVQTKRTIRATIDTAGNLGIGTPTPATLVDVVRNVNGVSNIQLTNADPGASAQLNYVVKVGAGGGYFGKRGSAYGDITATDIYVLASSFGSLNLGSDAGGIKFSTAVGTPVQRASISSGGNLILGGAAVADDGVNQLQVTGTSKFNNVVNVAGSANDLIRVVGSSTTRAGIYAQATNANSQGSFYFENNRGGFASYGGLLSAGSNNTQPLFGTSRADMVALFNDGARGKGMMIGTLNPTPFIMGTNNIEYARISATGMFGVSNNNPTYNLDVTGTARITQGIILGRRAVADITTTLTGTDYVIAYTSLTGTRAITLPAASSVGTGQTFVIKDEAGTATTNNLTIAGIVNGTLNPVAVNINYGVYKFYSNGKAWFTIQ